MGGKFEEKILHCPQHYQGYSILKRHKSDTDKQENLVALSKTYSKLWNF